MPASMAPAASNAVVGEVGLEMIAYTGVNDVDTYIGAYTGAAYVFGLFRRRAFVDVRDSDGLLGIYEDGLAVFRKAE